MSPPSPDKSHLAAAIFSLRVDSVLGEVAEALDAAAIGWLLLKGPAIRLRLYEDAARDYRDLDLLVDPDDELRAYDALRAIGLRPREGFGEAEDIALVHEWKRGADIVEVHVKLAGVGAPAPRVWGELSRHRRPLQVGGRTVWALDDAAMALHLALHAARHGVAIAKGIEDLGRGLRRLPRDAWIEASRMAEALSAEPAFAAAMRLVPAPLSAGVPVTGTPTTEALLHAQSAHPIAIGLARLDGDAELRVRLRRLLRILFPSQQFLRRWSSYDRERPLPYPVAYLWRLVYLVRHGPAAVIAWRRAGRTARDARTRAGADS